MAAVTSTLNRATSSCGVRPGNRLLGERARIAREIHDVLAHSLGALGVQIEAARSVLTEGGDIAAAIRLLEHARELADAGMAETREAILGLRADSPPLADGLTALAANHDQHYRRPVVVSIVGRARPIRPDANVALLRVACEALTNAARYAGGSAVTMHLEYTRRHTTLTVSNWRPDDLATRPGSGFGLAGMRERMQLAGGTLAAGPTGRQWIVRAQVPS